MHGKGYGSYKRLRRDCYEYEGLRFKFTRIQGDPYAPPSIIEVEAGHRFPRKWAESYPVPLADTVLRILWRKTRGLRVVAGDGYSGAILVPRPSPIVIRRSSVTVKPSMILVRARVGLPSRSRRILGEAAVATIRALLGAVMETLRTPTKVFEKALTLWRDQEYLRAWIVAKGFLGFVGDGSILPRKCGGCEEPLRNAVPFEAPPSLRVHVGLPSGRTISGLPLERGVTVIAGSAFHGKTTFLEAVAEGIWNHVEGDGREFVVTRRDAVLVKTEQGRYVSCVDISSFVSNLPQGIDTTSFTTSDASGATSVAASIQEAVEAGSKTILMDEDDVATNILYEDEEASRILKWRTINPITRLTESMKEHELSLVIASQGSKALFRAADRVLVVEGYRFRDATGEAKKVAGRLREYASYQPPLKTRRLRARRLVKPRIRKTILTAKNLETPIILTANRQLVEETQWRTLEYLAGRLHLYNGRELTQVVSEIAAAIAKGDFHVVAGEPVPPELGEVRAQDIAYLFNRVPWKC